MGRGNAGPIILVDIMSEDANTAVAPEPSKDSGVEVNALTQDDLAALFTGGEQEVVGGDPPEAAPAVDTGEETTEPDVLSQSDDSTEEESAPPKSVQKLLKQVNRLTARAKAAEEPARNKSCRTSNPKRNWRNTPRPFAKPNDGRLRILEKVTSNMTARNTTMTGSGRFSLKPTKH